MELRQYLKLSQQLVMTPQLQQAIKLLQLSRLEMSSLIAEQLTSNPILEDQNETARGETPRQEIREQEREFAGRETAQESAADGASLPNGLSDAPVPREGDDLNWQTFVENYHYFSELPSTGIRLTNEDLPKIENTLSRRSNLTDHLRWQLGMSPLSEVERQVAELIIGNIGEDGYLRDITLEDIATEAGVSLDDAEEVLLRIQELDPLGVAARDLRECLLIQARALYPGNRVIHLLIRDHLEDLEKRNIPPILKHLNIDRDALREALAVVASMEPKPGRAFMVEEPQYITPDIHVHKVGDEYVTVLNEDGLPKLKISPYYKNLLQSSGKPDEREYIQKKFSSAVWLIKSIHQRQNTIRKVTESIVRFQRDFLDRGVSYLRPLILRDVAEDVGLHESTVSRVTTNKYVHTPQGIFELKYFFNSRITGTQGQDLASESVKMRIKQLIDDEDRRRPLSDQRIVDILRKENVDIARRTVAKYREILGILSSSRRKQLV